MNQSGLFPFIIHRSSFILWSCDASTDSDSADPQRLQEPPCGDETIEGPQGPHRRRAAGRLSRHHGALRLGQDHDAQPHRRPRSAHRPANSWIGRAPLVSTMRPRPSSPSGGRAASASSFSSYHLLPDLTAYENVEVAAAASCRSPRPSAQRPGAPPPSTSSAWTDRHVVHRPGQLAGGQQQAGRRASPAPSATDPTLIVADEPTG